LHGKSVTIRPRLNCGTCAPCGLARYPVNPAYSQLTRIPSFQSPSRLKKDRVSSVKR
jgi:threonine dehydrogenase-like Zn-dependent dehydrogenase